MGEDIDDELDLVALAELSNHSYIRLIQGLCEFHNYSNKSPMV